jgi:hypothetical protein
VIAVLQLLAFATIVQEVGEEEIVPEGTLTVKNA